jgi:fatty-acyl-CoA synthase
VRGEPGHALTPEEVLAHCRGRIASFKIPRHVLFVEEFPMTSSGKIQKAALREQARRQLAAPAGAS